MEVYIAVIVLIFLLWIQRRKKHFLYFKELAIPGPEPSVIFGNLVELYRKGPLQCHKEWIEKHGRVVGYFNGLKPVLLVADSNILKNVFIKDFQKFINREPLIPIVTANRQEKNNNTIDRLTNKQWKDMRSVMSRLFTATKLKQLQMCLDSPLQTAMDILKKKAETGDVFNVVDSYSNFLVDVASKAVYSAKNNSQTNPKSSLQKALTSYFPLSFRDPLFSIAVSFPFLRWPCVKAYSIKRKLRSENWNPTAFIVKSFAKILHERRGNKKSENFDFLQYIMNSKIPMDVEDMDFSRIENHDKEIGEAVSKERESSSNTYRIPKDMETAFYLMNIFFPTYVSQKDAIVYLTYMLAKHEDVQERLYEEIKRVHQHDANFRHDVLNNFEYMENVIKETLRLYPPNYLFSNRLAAEDVQYGDLKIPRGTVVQAAMYFLHHDPEYWDDPEKFDPDRWNNENIIDAQKNAYMPYGIGPRNCVGIRYAQMLMKQILAHLFLNFKFTLAEGQENLPLTFGIRSLSFDSVKVKVELRGTRETL